MKKVYGNIKDLYPEVKNGRIQTVAGLWHEAHVKNPTLRFEEFLKELDASVSGGSLALQEPPIRSFEDYVKSWRYGFRVWLMALGIITALVVVESLTVDFPLIGIRWVAGTFLILIAPGYTFTWAFFPSRKQLAGLNRFALTIAMSLFLVPATALLLNYTPIGIHTEPLSAILAALSLVFLYVGMRREFVIARRV